MHGHFCQTAITRDTKIPFLFVVNASELEVDKDKFPDYLVTDMNEGLVFDLNRRCTGFVDYTNTQLGFPVTIRVFKK